MSTAAQMAAQGQRSGKFRHIYGEPAKPDGQFKEVKSPMTSGEGQYLKANDKFFAVAKSGGGGPVYVRRLDKPGRFSSNPPMLSVHKGKCLDMDFNPFIGNMLATVSEDCSVCVTLFPVDGLKETITKSDVQMKGHGKKVVLTQFNPSANNILVSGSFDRTVKLWDISKGSNISTYKGLGDNIYSLNWNYDGSKIAATSKDKKLHIFDPRQVEEAASCQAFDGTKSSKSFWLPNLQWIGSTGFSKTAKRQIKFWDLKDLSKPIKVENLDQASSVNMPHYDNDLGLLFLFGKGDGTVSWYEVINDNKSKLYALGQYRNPEPQKGGGFVSKRGLDVFKCEVQRFLKLTSKSVIPIPLVVPRKAGADVFQEDIYPDCHAGKSSIDGNDWTKGDNKDPILMSMDPEQRKNDDDEEKVQFEKKKTYDELDEENKQLKEEIQKLKEKIAELQGGDDNNGGGDDNVDDNNGNYNEDDNGGGDE